MCISRGVFGAIRYNPLIKIEIRSDSIPIIKSVCCCFIRIVVINMSSIYPFKKGIYCAR